MSAKPGGNKCFSVLCFLEERDSQAVLCCAEPVINTRTCVRYLGLGHAVQVQIPPVGHIRQQVAVVDGVAVQVHTLGLDQQDDIWRGGGNISEATPAEGLSVTL